MYFFFFFQAEDGIRDLTVTGVQTCALPIFCPTSRAGSPISARRRWRELPSSFPPISTPRSRNGAKCSRARKASVSERVRQETAFKYTYNGGVHDGATGVCCRRGAGQRDFLRRRRHGPGFPVATRAVRPALSAGRG